MIKAAGAGDPEYGAMREAFARYVTGQQSLEPWTFATYALLHGSWMHVIFNSVWLAAFGTPVARRCGAWRYGAIALIGIIAGGILHPGRSAQRRAPGRRLGGDLGADGRGLPVRVPDPGLGLPDPVLAGPDRPPAETIPELLRNRTAAAFLAIWLVTNLLFGSSACRSWARAPSSPGTPISAVPRRLLPVPPFRPPRDGPPLAPALPAPLQRPCQPPDRPHTGHNPESRGLNPARRGAIGAPGLTARPPLKGRD